jgi:heterodisulfide reductase subunit A-like polyferredoxin
MAASASVFRFEPGDQYNQTLAANVHPSDWVNPVPKRRYNLVVVGGGTARLVTAAGAAGLGASVALVEKTLMGGDCPNFGCVPSKALIREAINKVADAFNRTRLTPRVKRLFSTWFSLSR